MKQSLLIKTVDEICECIIDYRGKTPVKTDSGVRLITAKVIKNGRIIDSDFEYIADDDYDGWMRRGLPKVGDVLVTTEAPLGEVAMIRSDERIALAQRVILLRANPAVCDPYYLLYAFQSAPVQGEILSRASGCTVVGIKNCELRKVMVSLPCVTQQRDIGAILSTYDDLIENNRRRINLLEEAARQLYHEWFVRLRFPGYEHTRIVDGVPDGWERKTLGDICAEIRDTVSPEALEPETPYIGLEHIPRRSISLTEWETADKVTSTKHRFKQGDILFGKIRPYFHKVGVAFTDGIASSDAIVIRPSTKELHSIVLATVSSDEFVAVTSQTMREGSKMPRADWKQMIQYPVLLPPPGLLLTFSTTIQPIVAQLRCLCFQNDKLREARDLLLPRLMNGEIAV